MTADEIRSYGVGNVNTEFYEMAELLRELAAQSAESNESRKPRWVNLSTTNQPCLIDATQVVGLGCGMVDGRSCVIIRVRGSHEPFVAFDADHDEVRSKLGIDEDWITSSRQKPAIHPDYMPINKIEWQAARSAIEAARQLIDPSHTEHGAAYLDNLREAIAEWDGHQLPF